MRPGVSGRARVVGLAVAVWLVAVTGTTTLAWVVIDRAGRSIGSTPTAAAADLRPPPASVAGSPTAPVGAPRSTTAARTPASTSAATTTGPVPGPTRTGSEPVVPVVPAPGSTSSTTRPTTRPPARPTGEPTTRTPPPTAAGVQRAVHVQGGEVAVRCVGGSIALRWAQPDDGWAVETGTNGPAEVEVGFRSSADGVERETQVHAACQRGAPVLEVETRGSSEG